MRHRIERFILALALCTAAAAWAPEVLAFGSLGTEVNTFCSPATPYTGDCNLCHVANRATSTPAKTAFSAGNLAFFCPAPTPIQADAGPAQTVAEGTRVNLDGSNSSGSIAAYQWTQISGPTVALGGAATSRATFTAPAVGAGGAGLVFQLSVRDAAGTTSTASATVNVTNVNQPPVANAGPTQSVAPGGSVTLDGTNSSDPDAGALSFLWTQTAGTAVTLSSATLARPTFTAPASGSLTFQLRVSDPQGLSATATTTVNVTPPGANAAPIAQAGADQLVAPGATVTLTGAASSDSDGTLVSFLWSQLGGTAVTLSNPAAVTTTFQAPQNGSLTFRLTVTDNGGLTATDTAIVNVSVADPPPVASATAPQFATAGEAVTLDGTTSSGAISHLWTQLGGPPVTLSDPAAAAPTFTAPEVATPQDLAFRLTVTGATGLQSTAGTTVTVAPRAGAGAANPGAPSSGGGGGGGCFVESADAGQGSRDVLLGAALALFAALSLCAGRRRRALARRRS